MELILHHPSVDTLILLECPGSIDDDSNILACHLIRHHGFTTVVPADGEVASGGVDLFLSGAQRMAEPGARFGVHSWGGVGESGKTCLVMTRHEMYLEFCRDMEIPRRSTGSRSGGPDEIHWMTREELDRFNCVTEWAEPQPRSRLREFGVTPAGVDATASTKASPSTPRSSPPGKSIESSPNPACATSPWPARQSLQFFLTDVPGSRFGSDKSAVANAMANNRAMLMMPEGRHREGREPDIHAQPLFEHETPVDGSRWYIENDWEHRDAGFEEIFHLVHDAGIGTFMPGALPEYQLALDAEARAAIEDGRWGIPIDPGVRDWLEELEDEDSLAQEYIASVTIPITDCGPASTSVRVGCGASTAARPETNSTGGSTRPRPARSIPAADDARVRSPHHPTFMGTFSLTYDPANPYHKSRWYVDARLTGGQSSNLLETIPTTIHRQSRRQHPARWRGQ